jgi:hypothetical protein
LRWSARLATFSRNDQLEKPPPLGLGDQRLQRQPADTHPTVRAVDVHRMLRDRVIAGPRPVPVGAGPGDELPVAFHHHRRVVPFSLSQQPVDIGHRARLGLEGGDGSAMPWL